MATNYVLEDRLDEFVRALVANGRYASADNVLRDSLHLLEQRELVRETKRVALQKEIQIGLDSGLSDALNMNEIKTAARLRVLSGHLDLDDTDML